MDFWAKNWEADCAKRNLKKPVYDLWLDKYGDILETSREAPVIDLGCGLGNDSRYLAERGYRVVACDLSELALGCVRDAVPGAELRRFDMLGGLPFGDGSARVVIADLCLHYFRWADTVRIAEDIKRVLAPGGHLLCRLNSTADYEHGAGKGEMIEDNLYLIKGKTKRFFDERQIRLLFAGWTVVSCREERMERYERPKLLWDIAVRKDTA